MVSCWGEFAVFVRNLPEDMGFLPPVVHIRDNMDLQPARYRILMKGVEIGSGDAYPGRWLAINLVLPPGRYRVRKRSIRLSDWTLSGLKAH